MTPDPIVASTTTPRAAQALTPEDLVMLVPQITLGEARKLVSRVHREGVLPSRTPPEVRRVALDAVRAVTHVPGLQEVARTPSAVDTFVKYSLATADGGVVEAVRIPLERDGRVSVCVSSQVGCGLACAFCATGRLGLRRNLEAWEIVEQVRIVRADLPAGMRVHGVVFQGMGEPLSNFKELKQAARVLSEPCAQAIDARNITVSTAGLPSGIRALASELPRLRLALSLGSALRDVRKRLMPIEAAQPLDRVLEAAGEHATITGNAPLFAYTLLAGQNDTLADAAALATLVRDFAERYGRRPRLSLIPYNAIGGDDPFVRSSDEAEAAFSRALIAHGVTPKRRYSGGSDVAAACGQLATPSLTDMAGLSRRRPTA